jgi:hypothetical protein
MDGRWPGEPPSCVANALRRLAQQSRAERVEVAAVGCMLGVVGFRRDEFMDEHDCEGSAVAVRLDQRAGERAKELVAQLG